jgi:hypothetical protein
MNYLNTHFFYTADEFLCVNIKYNTACKIFNSALRCKNYVYLSIYDPHQILLFLWHTYGSMECLYVCTCMYVLFINVWDPS